MLLWCCILPRRILYGYANVGMGDTMSTMKTSLLELIAQTTELGNLPADWDDEGAERISLSNIVKAINLLYILSNQYPSMPVPTVGACFDGSIDLYWKQPDLT